jgi:hypothetical protein
MAIEIILDKICKHCGGNQWFVSYPKDRDDKKFICLNRKNELAKRYRNPENAKKWRQANPEKIYKYKRKWRNNNREKFNEYEKKWRKNNKEKFNSNRRERVLSLSDSYVKQVFVEGIRYDGGKMSQRDVTPKQIERQRFTIETRRKLKSEIMKTTEQKEEVIDKKKLLREKQQIYNKRYTEKKKSQKDYQDLAGVDYEEPIEVVKQTSYVDGVVEEFKKIELRRQEIIEQVETLNNYLESLKIKLS